MKPIDAGHEWGELVTFAKDQPPYEPLPARVRGDFEGTITTRWQLSDEERQAVAAGGDLLLYILTFGAPLQPLRFGIAGIVDRRQEA